MKQTRSILNDAIIPEHGSRQNRAMILVLTALAARYPTAYHNHKDRVVHAVQSVFNTLPEVETLQADHIIIE